jgi:hypothetical protein
LRWLIIISILLLYSTTSVPATQAVEDQTIYRLAQTNQNEAQPEEKKAAGKLILGPDLRIYIVFVKGQEFVLPEPAMGYISGVSRDLTPEEAEANLIQFATLESWNTWLRCLEARDKSKKKEISEDQANLVCADADEKSAILKKVTALAMLKNPFADPEEWEEQLSEAEQALVVTQIAKRKAIARGATLDSETAEGFTPYVGFEGDNFAVVPTETTWNRGDQIDQTTSPAGFTQ